MSAFVGAFALACSMAWGGVAMADETTKQITKTRWDDRPWAFSANIGLLSPLGQLGASIERAITRNVAVAAGTGVDMLSGYPYDAGARGRHAVAARLRRPSGGHAFGVQAHAFLAELRKKVDHATYDVLHRSINVGADVYFERRWVNGFTWRFMIGASALVAYDECEGWCNDVSTGKLSSITFALTLGQSF